MSFIPLLTTSLKGFAAFWAFVLFAVSASFIAKSNSYFGSGAVNASNFAAGNALIAGGILFMLYIGVALFFIFRKPESIVISVMVDTIMFGIFFIYFLASTAALSTEASFFSRWDSRDTWASLGNAVVGLGWVMTFLVLGILLFEVIYTFKHYGGSYATWRTPFNQLISYGSGSASSKSHTEGTAGIASTGNPATTANTGVPMSNVTPTAQTQAQTYEAPPPAHTYAPAPATAQGQGQGEPHHIITPYPATSTSSNLQAQGPKNQVNEKLSPYQGQLPPGAAA
ncbi:uncharacterized protein I303_101594 [Kwoniella dejecticola CBS 10117]|uniref:MARVEL domain-containing protein n=1 Tax=Kwoniella dejecticola CBS 10117 TaxID=1296121 RepID=A0A1A6ADC4_9TREE|nr:uncharacterized protein I303_02272 [Kwoniella dejecticola CBS 10117]OBR88054.1 hypothetical protein I303_02272 [Kwoniella dejecticola CBS 10117]